MQPFEPVLTLHLFPEERAALLDLLGGLSDDDWKRPTVCEGWSVRDVALHVLGDDLGVLSRRRDAFADMSLARGAGDLSVWENLVAYLNHWNDVWVTAARRLSPALMIELLRFSGETLQRYYQSLDMMEAGPPVSWAGPQAAPVWLDVAREYTERWLHQQQIRDALESPGLTEPRLFAPVLDTFARALPQTFHGVLAPEGTHVRLTVSGEAGGVWSLVRHDDAWELYRGVESEPAASVTLDQDDAWRLFTKGLSRDEAFPRARFAGDHSLCMRVLDTVSIIA